MDLLLIISVKSSSFAIFLLAKYYTSRFQKEDMSATELDDEPLKEASDFLEAEHSAYFRG